MMKNLPILLLGFVCFLWSTTAMVAQNQSETKKEQPKKKNNKEEEVDEGPLVYKFEPNYTDAQLAKMAEFKRRKAIIDTMTISENKRRKLLRDLYKAKGSKRLSKVMLADTKFEDIEK